MITFILIILLIAFVMAVIMPIFTVIFWLLVIGAISYVIGKTIVC